ncbi:MAG: HIT family protein [Acidobacteriaceae bacterium]|nr:HIT family protein [Acidobacteriaceae bacterium]MBV9780928.1 HIT family protein [Acidobacteriaceae bacterium]
MAVENPACVFCKIAARDLAAEIVHQNSQLIAFLDSHPLFPGHVLLCPREHYETLLDLPAELSGPMMAATQVLAKAVEAAVNAEGTFIAINNRISQTVPHLHIHVVPRRRRDGLKGFFWPRQQYRDQADREAVRAAIEREVQKLLG